MSKKQAVANKDDSGFKPDKPMLDSLRKGDRKSLSAFYDRYAPMLLSVATRYVGNVQDAEDILQESLIRIFKALDTFKPGHEGSFEAWAKRIVVNLSLNFLRKHNRMKFVNGSEIDMAMNQQNDPWEVSDPETMPDPETVIAFITALPEGYRTVLNLYVFENYSHKQIGSELGISENTSKSQLSKARNLLRKKINNQLTPQHHVEYEQPR
ncbi:MAG: RNA polymerase sigma factor [Bacteroidales bacterium]|nr:RNA polymerase sigma factor [Bacteroidales bacterium]